MNVERKFFRKKILVASFDKMSKRIPAEKYEWFVKRRVMTCASLLNNLRLKTITAKKDLTFLRNKFMELKDKQGKVTLNDCNLAKMETEDLTQKVREAQKLLDEIKIHKSEYLFKKLLLSSFSKFRNLSKKKLNIN